MSNSHDEIKKLINEAILVEKAGDFSVVLECITPKTAKKITKLLLHLEPLKKKIH